MTTACVSEYAELTLVYGPNGVPAQCPKGPPIAVQNVDYTAGAAATTNAFNNKTKFLRIDVDSTCARKFGATPVAATTDERQQAGAEYIGLPSDHGSGTGQVAYKLGFITRT